LSFVDAPEPPRGEGRGHITRDGCAVEVYLKLPYRGELELLAAHLSPHCTILELGCGTGRLTRRLLEAGHAVVAVDNSEEMLRHVPDAATTVCSDIEALNLARTFDVVLYASNLINTADDSMRRAQLDTCRRHLAPGGKLLFQRFDPAWISAVEPGPVPSMGEVDIAIERVVRRGPVIDMSVRYAIAEAEWRHHFTARPLDDEEVRLELRAAGFGELSWIGTKWGAGWMA
jgi:SAM-dependent methyltransferase